MTPIAAKSNETLSASPRCDSADMPATQTGNTVQFTDIQRVLSLFAEGIAGRFLHLTPIEQDTGSASSDHQRDVITTLGSTIHLPSQIADFAQRRHNEAAYRVAVLHQIGYLEFATHAFDLDQFASATVKPQLTKRIFMTLEDLRIDSLLKHRYPGSAIDVTRVLNRALATRRDISPSRALAFLLETLVRFSLGARRADLESAVRTEPLAEFIRLLNDAAERMTSPTATVFDTASASIEVLAIFEAASDALRIQERDAALDRPEQTATDESEPSASSEPPAIAAGGRPDSKVDSVELTADDFDGAAIDFRGELGPDSDSRTGQAGGAADSTQEPPVVSGSKRGELKQTRPEQPIDEDETWQRSIARVPVPEGPRTYFYDEWDYLRQRYEPAWCRLFEHQIQGTDFTFIHDVRRRHSSLAQQVKRRFGAIRPEAWQRVHHTPDGDELSLDALVQTVVDRRTGYTTDETLYIRRDRAVREVAAAFLLDMSRSTDSPVFDPNEVKPPTSDPAEFDPYLRGGYFDFDSYDLAPKPVKRRVIDVAKESLAVMCDALQTLGDNHAIYGFSGSGRLNVEFHVAKEFTVGTSARTWAALAAMEPIRYTRMGPAIRHCVTKLAKQPERTKVLVVVTDGYPQDDGYGPDRNDRKYGIHDTARAIREAGNAGIATFCVTVDPAGNDYLREMCAPDRYLVIDDVNALATELEKVYRTLTGR